MDAQACNVSYLDFFNLLLDWKKLENLEFGNTFNQINLCHLAVLRTWPVTGNCQYIMTSWPLEVTDKD